MADPRIRRATADDLDRVVELLHHLLAEESVPDPPRWRRGLQGMLDAPQRGVVLVAEGEAGLLGAITVSYNLAARFGGAYAQIEELIVDPEARGLRMGELLLQAAIVEASAAGCREIGLYSRENTRAFYERYGFVYAGPELRRPLS